MYKRISEGPDLPENNKSKPRPKLNTTVATNDVTFRVESDSPLCDKEDAASRFLNMTLDQIAEKEENEESEKMAAYHYEPCDVYEILEVDVPRPEIPLLEFEFSFPIPDFIEFDVDFN